MTPETSFSMLEALKNSALRAEAFQRFVSCYQGTIFAWCRQRGLQEADVGDLTQEILANLWQKLRHFEYDRAKKFHQWLSVVVRHAVIDYFRKKPRQPQAQGG